MITMVQRQRRLHLVALVLGLAATTTDGFSITPCHPGVDRHCTGLPVRDTDSESFLNGGGLRT